MDFSPRLATHAARVASATPESGQRVHICASTKSSSLPPSLRETDVLIHATITFTPGGLYQLWSGAVNCRGPSLPGPVQNWTMV